jgi:hypothetical protein
MTMAKTESKRSAALSAAAPASLRKGRDETLEHTDRRIHAYINSMTPLRGVVWAEDVEAGIWRGRAAIEALAASAQGAELPRLKLTPAQCADILTFMSSCEPLNPARWWLDADVSHVCGYNMVLDAMAGSLRRANAAGEVRS